MEINQELKNSILKTGTSIIGIICKDGIVMAGDRQVTAGGSFIMDKNTPKIIQINNYLIGGWTGGAADIQMLKKIVAAELRLKELRTKSRPSVKEAANLFAMITYKNIRQFSTLPHIVGSLIGGFNENGTFELYTIEPAGGVKEVEEYDANFGSGMPFMLGLLEKEYKKDITVEQGVELAVEAIQAASQRDIGSGFGVDVFTITSSGINHVVDKKIQSILEEKK